jgi:hypothetical protein
LKVGTTPITGELVLSFNVIVTVEVDEPLATTGPVAVIEEFAIDGEPVAKTTVPPAFTNGVAIESVFVSAVVELIVQVETPEAFEEEQVL